MEVGQVGVRGRSVVHHVVEGSSPVKGHVQTLHRPPSVETVKATQHKYHLVTQTLVVGYIISNRIQIHFFLKV